MATLRFEEINGAPGAASVPYLVSEDACSYGSAREFQRAMVRRVRAAGADPRTRFRLVEGGIEYHPRRIVAGGEECTVIHRVTVLEERGAA